MKTINNSALETVHRLLFRALIEMRAQGHEQKNKLVFHLADLFHNVVLEMENAAVRDLSRKYTVALSRMGVRTLRALLREACAVFAQKLIYLSVAGMVEFVERSKK